MLAAKFCNQTSKFAGGWWSGDEEEKSVDIHRQLLRHRSLFSAGARAVLLYSNGENPRWFLKPGHSPRWRRSHIPRSPRNWAAFTHQPAAGRCAFKYSCRLLRAVISCDNGGLVWISLVISGCHGTASSSSVIIPTHYNTTSVFKRTIDTKNRKAWQLATDPSHWFLVSRFLSRSKTKDKMFMIEIVLIICYRCILIKAQQIQVHCHLLFLSRLNHTFSDVTTLNTIHP